MIGRLLQLAAVIGVAAALSGLFLLKGAVQARRDRAVALADQIARDEEAVRVLKAEIAYLSSPRRIAAAVRALDGLQLITPDQVIADWSAIPVRLDPKAPVEGAADLAAPMAPPPRNATAVRGRPALDHAYLQALAERRP